MIYENLSVNLAGEYDVAVAGGGIAGISAALAAARCGKRVVLFEKGFVLGGLATAGIVTIYLPLCDGYGNQVSFGIAEELLRLSIKYGAEDRYPENWLDGVGTRTENDKRFQVQYNPHLFAILAEQLLTDAGVDIAYGSYVVNTAMKGDKIDCLITESKSGRRAYKVGSVVDATGDCDVAHLSGAPTETFKQGNVLAAWYYFVADGKYDLKMLGASDVPDEEKTVDNAPKMLSERRFGGLDADELSDMVRLSHHVTLDHYLKNKEKHKEFWPVNIASIPQIRMTRRIVGEYELSLSEEHTEFEDSIGMISNWKKRGPIYEVPFRTLYSSRVKNLICAGRCTSVDEPMWDVMRVIPPCAVTGEAAGVAAAMSDDFTTLDVSELQARLRECGVIIHKKDIIK